MLPICYKTRPKFIYVTMLQGICITRVYVYTLKISGYMYIPWFTQGMYTLPEKSRVYTYTLKICSNFYTLTLKSLFNSIISTVVGGYGIIHIYVDKLTTDIDAEWRVNYIIIVTISSSSRRLKHDTITRLITSHSTHSVQFCLCQ